MPLALILLSPVDQSSSSEPTSHALFPVLFIAHYRGRAPARDLCLKIAGCLLMVLWVVLFECKMDEKKPFLSSIWQEVACAQSAPVGLGVGSGIDGPEQRQCG